MSCEILPIAKFTSVQNVLTSLHLPDKYAEDWLNNSLISISPTQEIIIIAYDITLTILTSRWDSIDSQNIYSVSWSNQLDPVYPITAVMALPLTDLGKESQVGTDWTCIIVGFATGYCKFFTENMGLLLSVRFHDEPVMHIKSTCSTISSSSRRTHNENLLEDELYITYQSNVSVINANVLFQILCNNRQELARAQGTFTEPNLLNDSSLSLRKWGFSDQGQLVDSAVVGLTSANVYNHLLTASIVGGFHSRYRSAAPKNTLVLTAGARPYLGFQYAMEGGSQPIFSDMAKAVASKLKSALPSWLTGSRTTSDPVEQPPIPAEAMTCRFGLCDFHRRAESIILSPDKQFSVITDSLGRVSLIDNQLGIVLRMWKGYRDSQCAFLNVLDPECKSRRHDRRQARYALFLIIYLPKKGLIEIWALQQGPKVASFSALKHGRLFYMNYNKGSKLKQQTKYSCIFMDPDGTLKEFNVPFHFAIADKDSKRARDIHLFRHLKAFIKSGNFDQDKLSEEILGTIKELRTVEIKAQFIDMLVGNRHISENVLLQALLEILPEKPSEDEEQFCQKCTNLKHLTEFYIYATNCEENPSNSENNKVEVESNEEAIKQIDSNLQLSERDLKHLQELLNLTINKDNKVVQSKVTFKEDKKPTFSIYISAFDCSVRVQPIAHNSEITYNIAETIFNKFISTNLTLEEWVDKANCSHIPTDYFVKLLLIFWLNRPLTQNMNLEHDMKKFGEILYEICKLTGFDNICTEYNEISPWWENVREILIESPCPFKGLMAAILCRHIAQRVERDKELMRDEEACEEIWERVSADNCKWSLLIGKLEDISLLNIVLNMKNIAYDQPILTKLNYEGIDISLKFVLMGGKGIVSELVSKWLASYGVNPQEIVDNELIHLQSVKIASTPEKSPVEEVVPNDDTIEPIKPIFEQYNLLHKQFPFSLQAVVILSNMAWEYSENWKKNLDDIRSLKSAVQCLDCLCNVHLKHGVCALMWCMHIRSVFEAVCRMLNKAGKLPKDRLCKQETGLNDGQVIEFLAITIEFIAIFMRSIQKCYDTVREPLKYEDLWEDNSSPSLSQLAMQQTKSNYELLLLHYELASTMHMLTYFNTVRFMKPLVHLFDNFGQQSFFVDLNTRPQLPGHAPDQKVLNARISFLTKIISASIDLIHKNDNGTIYSSDAFSWMEKIKDLGALWSIEQDILVRHQVLELFRRGFDGLAEDMLGTLANIDNLGPELLDVAGKQLRLWLEKIPEKRIEVAALGPILTSYLDTLEIKDPITIENKASVMIIATHALRCFSDENSKERRLVALIVDAGHLLLDDD